MAALMQCEEHLDDQVSLADLASIAGYSPHHFHRIFRAVVGEAPKEYVRRLRLELAVRRLKTTPDDVLDIALASGFATHETFTRAFVHRFGISPSEFRSVVLAYRQHVGIAMGSRTFAGFTDDTPLTLRFDVGTDDPVAVERTPPRHLLFVRHYGFERLLVGRPTFLSLWDDLFAYADAHGIEYSPALVIGITHDDPYVTDDDKIRFDACLPVAAPIPTTYPIGCRYLPPSLCVKRRHTGGLEEIAKTFANIGVEWFPTSGSGLLAAPPFEIHHCVSTTGGIERVYSDAFVPLEPISSPQEE